MRKLKFRKVKKTAKGDTTNEWQRQDSHTAWLQVHILHHLKSY